MNWEPWISIFCGLNTILYSIFARRFEGNVENYPKKEPWKPKLWERVGGVCLGAVFFHYGVYLLRQ